MGDDPVLYLIRVNGHLGPTFLAAVPALTPRYQVTEMVLTGLLGSLAIRLAVVL